MKKKTGGRKSCWRGLAYHTSLLQLPSSWQWLYEWLSALTNFCIRSGNSKPSILKPLSQFWFLLHILPVLQEQAFSFWLISGHSWMWGGGGDPRGVWYGGRILLPQLLLGGGQPAPNRAAGSTAREYVISSLGVTAHVLQGFGPTIYSCSIVSEFYNTYR